MALRRHVLGLTALLYLSPFVGLLVELALARTFGASAIVDAYRVAALLLITGSGLLTSTLLRNVIVPAAARHRAEGQELKAWQSAMVSWLVLVALVGPLSVVILVWPEAALGVLGPGLKGEGLSAGRLLIGIAAVGLIVRLFAGAVASVLQTYGVFWVQPTSQTLLNLSLLAAVLTLGLTWQADALAMAMVFGVACGLALHIAVGIRTASRAGLQLRSVWALPHPLELGSIMMSSLPLLAIAGFQQWQSIIIIRSLTEVGEGALALYGYGEKIMQLGALPAIAFVTVLFPRLADVVARGAKPELAEQFIAGCRYLAFITVPMALAVMIIADDIVWTLFGNSALSTEEMGQLIALSRVLAWSIPILALLLYFRQFAFALKKLFLAACVMLAIALVQTASLPAAAAYGGLIAVAAVNLAILASFEVLAFIYLARCLGTWGGVRFLWMTASAAGMAAAIGYLADTLLGTWADSNPVRHLLQGGALFGLMVGTYVFACRLFGLREAGAALAFAGAVLQRVGWRRPAS